MLLSNCLLSSQQENRQGQRGGDHDKARQRAGIFGRPKTLVIFTLQGIIIINTTSSETSFYRAERVITNMQANMFLFVGDTFDGERPAELPSPSWRRQV